MKSTHKPLNKVFKSDRMLIFFFDHISFCTIRASSGGYLPEKKKKTENRHIFTHWFWRRISFREKNKFRFVRVVLLLNGWGNYFVYHYVVKPWNFAIFFKKTNNEKAFKMRQNQTLTLFKYRCTLESWKSYGWFLQKNMCFDNIRYSKCRT